jgi:hypothetical protein
MGQVNTSPTKPKSTNNPNTLRPSTYPRQRPPLADETLPWRMAGRNSAVFYIRQQYRGPSIWHQYGVRPRCGNGHRHCKDKKDPVLLFTCKMECNSRHHDEIDQLCRNIVMALIEHRDDMHCDCDVEYITKGTTSKDSPDICEKRDEAILKAMRKHNKSCTCGAFELVEPEKEKSRARTIKKTPSGHKLPTLSKMSMPSEKPISSKMPTSSEKPVPFKPPPSSKVSTPTKPPEEYKKSMTPKPPTPRKTLTYPHKHPLDDPKDPFEDLSDDEYEQNVFKGLPRKW